jgi:SAM-dependent methyltransferase
LTDHGQGLRDTDGWDSGATYESYVGRWSRLVAREFVRWLDVPSGLRWLDVGCGTGALSQTVLDAAEPSALKGVDPSPAFVAYSQQQIVDRRASFEVGDAQRLPVATGSCHAVVSGLVLNFIPDQAAALREMVRAAKPAGVVAAYVWDYADGMRLLRHFWDAATALQPDALALDEGRRFPVCQPEPLVTLFLSAGLQRVEVHSIEIPTRFSDFDDCWTPFLGGQGPAPSYVASLSERDRALLREGFKRRLPVDPAGSIDMTARAWAVRGSSQNHLHFSISAAQ